MQISIEEWFDVKMPSSVTTEKEAYSKIRAIAEGASALYGITESKIVTDSEADYLIEEVYFHKGKWVASIKMFYIASCSNKLANMKIEDIKPCLEKVKFTVQSDDCNIESVDRDEAIYIKEKTDER